MTTYVTGDDSFIQFSDPDHRGHARRAREWFGWTPLRQGDPTRCPRLVVGKRCQGWDRCMCAALVHTLDHGRLWRTEDGKRILTGEPYGCSGKDLAQLVTTVEDLGLEVFVDNCSPYFPGHTVLLVIHEPGTTWVDRRPGVPGFRRRP
jgi:hypothetical protein